MSVAAKSKSHLHKNKYNFNQQVSNKILYLDFFSCINFPITAKYKSEKLIAKSAVFKF